MKQKLSRMKVGPFTWERSDDDSGEECWNLVLPEGVGITFFCVKNYGGIPTDGNGFSGWRLVSGGPFSQAGGWTTREAAMRGVIPYLLRRYRREVKRKREELKTYQKTLGKFLRGIVK